MFSNRSEASNRVLIADDDPVIRRLLAAAITSADHVPVEVSDGRQAYRLLQKDADFKAAIIDMIMPHLNGVDLIGYMKTEKRMRRIPVLLITAEKDLKVMSAGFSAEAKAYLPKPFTPEQLQSALRLLAKAWFRE